MNSEQKIVYSIVKRIVDEKEKEERPVLFLTEALNVGKREVISLVGAGGKTTLMFRLARELSCSGRKVVTATTTKILEPLPEEGGCLYINSEEDKIKDFVRRQLEQYHHITVSTERLESGKLKGISSGLVDGLWRLTEIDAIIVEADGAAGRPVKAPRENEPVIPSRTTVTIGVLGVDGLGAKLSDKKVFYPEGVSEITGIPVGERLTDKAIAVLVTQPRGIFKGAPPSSRAVVLINKMDIPGGLAKGKRIAQKILEERNEKIERVILGQLKNEPPVVEVIFP